MPQREPDADTLSTTEPRVTHAIGVQGRLFTSVTTQDDTANETSPDEGSQYSTKEINADQHTVLPPSELPVESSRVGRFTILRKLGAGGMGAVYSAYDDELDRKIAIKLLHPHYGRLRSAGTRMLREAQAMARVSHPNVVHIYEVGQFSGQLFLAMEFVPGQTLHEWRTAQPRTWREVLDMHIEAGRGLAAVHRASLVHRDYKPTNVLVGSDGRPRVLDFGLVGYREPGRAGASADPDIQSMESASGESTSGQSVLQEKLTHEGAIIGTPAYMSPEQHQGDAADAASDQFSFCVVLYEALFGVHPFGAHPHKRFTRMSKDALLEPPKHSPGKDLVPAQVREVLARGMRFVPAERWPTMDDLLAALQRSIQEDQQDGDAALSVTRRVQVTIAALSALLGVVLLGVRLFVITEPLAFDALLPPVLILLIWLIAVMSARTLLLQNPAARKLAWLTGLVFAAILASRAIELTLAVSKHEVVVYEQLSLALSLLIMAVTFHRVLVWMAGVWLLLLPITVLELLPYHVTHNSGLLLCGVLSLVYWARHRKDAQPPTHDAGEEMKSGLSSTLMVEPTTVPGGPSAEHHAGE